MILERAEFPRDQQPVQQFTERQKSDAPYHRRCQSIHYLHGCENPANHNPPCRCPCGAEWTAATIGTGRAFGLNHVAEEAG